MSTSNPSILYITDLYYPAKGRAYYTEDLYITSQLKDEFNLLICHPLHSAPFEEMVDLVVIRNSGPVIYYKEYFNTFFERVNAKGIKTYNSFDGSGDMRGKQYLITLTNEGLPVIPTIADLSNHHLLPVIGKYIVKAIEGADSIGMKEVSAEELPTITLQNEIVQPFIDFEYEVSFYFIDKQFQYALYAPNKDKRWQLERYNPTGSDVDFANEFVEWNTMTRGIQRVDACRTKDGNLLLVELEDLNPFLSLDLLDDRTRNNFIDNFKRALWNAINS